MKENVLGYLRNPCSLNSERDAAFSCQPPHAADRVLFGREIWGVDGACLRQYKLTDVIASETVSRNTANELAWFYRGSDIGHAGVVPKAWNQLTQHLVPYSENKGYASNPRRSALALIETIFVREIEQKQTKLCFKVTLN